MKKLTLLLIAGLCFSVSVGAQTLQEKKEIERAKKFVESKGLTWGGQGVYGTKGLYTYDQSNSRYYGKAYFGIGAIKESQQYAPVRKPKERIPGWIVQGNSNQVGSLPRLKEAELKPLRRPIKPNAQLNKKAPTNAQLNKKAPKPKLTNAQLRLRSRNQQKKEAVKPKPLTPNKPKKIIPKRKPKKIIPKRGKRARTTRPSADVRDVADVSPSIGLDSVSIAGKAPLERRSSLSSLISPSIAPHLEPPSSPSISSSLIGLDSIRAGSTVDLAVPGEPQGARISQAGEIGDRAVPGEPQGRNWKEELHKEIELIARALDAKIMKKRTHYTPNGSEQVHSIPAVDRSALSATSRELRKINAELMKKLNTE